MKKLLLLATIIPFYFFSHTACKKDSVHKPTDTIPNSKDTVYVQTTPWPKWVFQHWVWLDESDNNSARALVDDYLAHDIPVGAIIIDSPWETEYNTFKWDTTLYPDARRMVNYFHSRNVKVVVWITGVIDTNVHPLYDIAKANNYFIKPNATSTEPQIIGWWKGKGSLIDWYNPAAVTWWKGLMDSLLNIGIDGWKCDGTDYYAIGGGYSPGLGGTITRLDYSHKYYQLFHDYSRQKLGNNRVVMCRPIDNYGFDIGGDFTAFCPRGMDWACWVGDQDATFNGMKAALNNMYYSAEYKYLSFGSDIGGYREDNTNAPNMRSKELFIRWAQLGTFCGLMENGGGGEHRPWMFDVQTENIYRNLVKMREKYLVGYLLQESVKANAANKSLMYFFSKSNYEFMLGDDIYINPILTSSGSTTVNFPLSADRWVYLYDSTEVHDGGTSFTRTFPLEEYPVYLKVGSMAASIIKPK